MLASSIAKPSQWTKPGSEPDSEKLNLSGGGALAGAARPNTAQPTTAGRSSRRTLMVAPLECREDPTTDPLARAAFLTVRICGPPVGHVDQIAPSSRSTCRTSLAAMRRTQTWRGPMTSRVAQNSTHDPVGHIDSASTSILPSSWQTMT